MKQETAVTLGLTLAVVLALVELPDRAHGQDASPSLIPLSQVPVPEAPNLMRDYVKSRQAAIALGKALFWDMQVGGDGIQSCGSCHFEAGGDNRVVHQLSPGLARVHRDGSGFVPEPDISFQVGPPNYHLRAADYPFHDPGEGCRDSLSPACDKNDVTSSQGVHGNTFVGIDPNDSVDPHTPALDGVFEIDGIGLRRVEPRNTPTMINGVFFYRQFWDGRAQNDCNFLNPFGKRDRNPENHLYEVSKSGELKAVKPTIENSALCSQALGPPLNPFEMSADGRIFRNLGRKLLAATPLGSTRLPAITTLGQQLVDPDDSVLGGKSRAPKKGLKSSYEEMVRLSFHPRWWDSAVKICIAADSTETLANTCPSGTAAYTLAEYNFSMFWGLAIQMYEATLISAETPFDRYLAEINAGLTPTALTEQQRQGFEVFRGKGKCINCHGGAELTNASVRSVRNEPFERMIMGDGGAAIYDNGFYNIGTRPTTDDIAVGGEDPWGRPLSLTKLAMERACRGETVSVPSSGEPGVSDGPMVCGERVAVNGSFKTPALRNVALTAPYFHHGGMKSLEEVVEFYDRGGDFPHTNRDDRDPDIQRLGFTPDEEAALLAFLREALTDERVRLHKKPFDHPELIVPNGHPTPLVADGDGQATDNWVRIPAVGKHGYKEKPAVLKRFEELLSP